MTTRGTTRTHALLVTCAVTSVLAAAPVAAETTDYSGSRSQDLPSVPAVSQEVHRSLVKLCVGNPDDPSTTADEKDPYYVCEEARVDLVVSQPGFRSGTLTMDWVASRNGQRPDVAQSSGFPRSCNGSPGAEILLTTFSSMTKVAATLVLEGSDATSRTQMSVPAQSIPTTGRTIPAYACMTAV